MYRYSILHFYVPFHTRLPRGVINSGDFDLRQERR
nr:MAG TPA: hypothetical protein [Caudoviricetes sp.]